MVGIKRRCYLVLMKIMVSGVAGFIGKELALWHLKNGDEVVGVDNFYSSNRKSISSLLDYQSFEFIRHDVTFPLFIEVEAIYNLATPASPKHYQRNPVQTIKTIVQGSINQLGLAKRLGAKYLLASTSEVYGNPEMHPQSEDYLGNVNPLGIRACYDEGKRISETLAMEYRRTYGVDTKIARIFNTYGPGMSKEDGRVVSSFVSSILDGKPLEVFGDGLQTRSFCFIDDLLDGLVKLMESDSTVSGPINLGNPEEVTVLEVGRLLKEMSGKSELEDVHLPMPEDDPIRRCPDISRAKEILGWEPKISLQQGLEMTLNKIGAYE